MARPRSANVCKGNFFLCLLALLAAAIAASAQEVDRRARVAVLDVANPGSDSRLAPACSAVEDTVRLTLGLMGRYAVIVQPGLQLAADEQAFKTWCAEQRVDQAVYGEVRARTGGGYAVALRVFDRLRNRVTIEREERADGILDVFEATDVAVQALIEALSGEHVAFGTVNLEHRGEQGAYAVLIDGVEAGQSATSVRNVLIGRRTVVVRQQRLVGPVELARTAVTVPEDGSVTVRFEVPYLTADEKAKLALYEAAIEGRLHDAGAWGEVDGDLRGVIEFLGRAPHLPHLAALKSEYEMKAGLHDVFGAELEMQPAQSTDEAFAKLRAVEERAAAYPRPEELKIEVREAMQRTFALLRVSACGELAASRWDVASSRYELLQSVIDRGYLETPPSFAKERAFVAAAYADYRKGWKLFTAGPMRKKIRGWFGPQLDAAAAVLAGWDTLAGHELVVFSEPPGMWVTVNGVEAGAAPVRIRSLTGDTAKVTVADPWYGSIERTVVMPGPRTLLFVAADEAFARDAVGLEAKPAEQTDTDVWTLAWESVSRAVRYDLQVLAKDAGGQKVLESIPGLTATSYTLKRKLERGSRYSWSVRPVSANGIHGPWSTEAVFRGQMEWTKVPGASPPEGFENAAFHGETLFLYYPYFSPASSSGISFSKDLTTWNGPFAVPVPARQGASMLEFEGKLWIVGGFWQMSKDSGQVYSRDAWSTIDGLLWDRMTGNPDAIVRGGAQLFAFDDRLWVTGGSGDAVKKAPNAMFVSDGRNWPHDNPIPIPWASRVLALAFKGLIWTAFPDQNREVYSSADGSSWSSRSRIPNLGGAWDRLIATPSRLVYLTGPLQTWKVYPRFDVASIAYSSDGVMWKRAIPVSPDGPGGTSFFIALPHDEEVIVVTYDPLLATSAVWRGRWLDE